jgi:hypothetical protein
MQMNVQLHHVVTDLQGRTGMRIIQAIVAGNQAPHTVIASLVHPRTPARRSGLELRATR